MTGFDYHSFHNLLELFELVCEKFTPYTEGPMAGMILKKKISGRPREFSPLFILGLVLTWSCSKGSMRMLQLIFGIGKSSASIWLHFGLRILIKVLYDHPLAKVCLPTDEEVAGFVAAINKKYCLITDVWAAMDGLKIKIQCPGYRNGSNVQSHYYNGWTLEHCLSNLFVFSPDGKIRQAYLNCPGTTHNSAMASMSGVYASLDDVFERTGAKTVVDLAFTARNLDSLMKTTSEKFDAEGNIRRDLTKQNQAKSVCVLSEWGLNGFQSSFPCVKDQVRYKERGERKIQLICLVLLYNFRASTIGFNQIQTVFMPELQDTSFFNKYH